MKLHNHIKHFRRWRMNKKLSDAVDTIYMLATDCENPLRWQNMMSFFISPLMYEVMRTRYSYIPSNIVSSPILKEKDRFITSTREWCDIFHKEPDEKIKEELSSLPFSMFTNPELYMGVDIGLRPSVSAPIPNTVITKEV